MPTDPAILLRAPLRIFCVGDAGIAALGAGVVASAGDRFATLEAAGSDRPAVETLRRQQFDLVLFGLDGISAFGADSDAAVARVARLGGEALIVAVTSGDSVSQAVAAMRAGAHDCVRHDVGPDTLLQRLAGLAQRLGRGGALADLLPIRIDPAIPASAIAGPDLAVLPMWRQEQRIIENAVALFQGNIAMAAAALEISPSTIYRKRQSWAEGA